MIKEISIVFKMIFVLLLLHVNSTAATLQNGPPIVPIVPPQNPVAGGPNQGPGQHYNSFRCWAILYCLVMMMITVVFTYYNSRHSFSHSSCWLHFCNTYLLLLAGFELFTLLVEIAYWKDCESTDLCYRFWANLTFVVGLFYFVIACISCFGKVVLHASLFVIMLSISVVVKMSLLVIFCVDPRPLIVLAVPN